MYKSASFSYPLPQSDTMGRSFGLSCLDVNWFMNVRQDVEMDIMLVFTACGLQRLKSSDSERVRSTGGKGIRKSAIRRHWLILFENILKLLIVCVVQTVLVVLQRDRTAFYMASIPLFLRCLVHSIIYIYFLPKDFCLYCQDYFCS